MQTKRHHPSLHKLRKSLLTPKFVFSLFLITQHNYHQVCLSFNQQFRLNHSCCRISQSRRTEQITPVLLQTLITSTKLLVFNKKKEHSYTNKQLLHNNMKNSEVKTRKQTTGIVMTRSMFLSSWKILICLISSMYISIQDSNAFQIPMIGSSSSMYNKKSVVTYNTKESLKDVESIVDRTVVYKPLTISIRDGASSNMIDVPVACWYPYKSIMNDLTPEKEEEMIIKSMPIAMYQHRISIRRIGQLLVKWNWIPSFAVKNYNLSPTDSVLNVIDGQQLPLPSIVVDNNKKSPNNLPIILLAHGFLGSRYDLSHLAEELASNGFICLSVEYPESLAASYERIDGLDRRIVNEQLLQTMENQWKISSSKTTKFGIVGHSLGSGTVFTTGSNNWARISLAGFPRNDFPKGLNAMFITSTNDGAVSISRVGGKQAFEQANYPIIDYPLNSKMIPSRCTIIYEGIDAPNHISFLTEGVNNAMIDLLSPLLPVAQSLKIPVLDFDQYMVSRDSVYTASRTHPLIIQYLKQEMKIN